MVENLGVILILVFVVRKQNTNLVFIENFFKFASILLLVYIKNYYYTETNIQIASGLGFLHFWV